jgi:predicted site-specific integrase-resolvase
MLSERIFLTPAEVVARYNGAISVRTLANWRSAGISPPFTKVGGRIMYRLSDIEDWERKRTVESTSQYKRA